MLPLPVAREGLQPVAGRLAQIVEPLGGIQTT